MSLFKNRTFPTLPKVHMRPGLFFGLLIIIALLAFEMFNYSTTDFALRDLLGDLRFAGMRWATILAVAFCGIDFAGIARLFTPQQGADEPREVWYLFGAWLLAATMNALLTWWGVSMAVASHTIESSSVMDPNLLLKVVPIFVAIMVWVIRILIIGTISVAGERIFAGDYKHANVPTRIQPSPRPTSIEATRSNVSANAAPILAPRPAINNRPSASMDSAGRPEPTYHSMSMTPPDADNTNARPSGAYNPVRRL